LCGPQNLNGPPRVISGGVPKKAPPGGFSPPVWRKTGASFFTPVNLFLLGGKTPGGGKIFPPEFNSLRANGKCGVQKKGVKRGFSPVPKCSQIGITSEMGPIIHQRHLSPGLRGSWEPQLFVLTPEGPWFLNFLRPTLGPRKFWK